MQKIGIIGSGSLGAAAGALLSRNFVVKFGTRSPISPAVLDKCKKENTSTGSINEVMLWGDIVVLALPADVALKIAEGVKHELDGKIVIDATNPLKWDAGPVWTPPPEGSMTLALAARLPRSRLIKTFNTLGFEHVEHPKPGADLLFCGDDKAAKEIMSKIISASGFRPIDSGGLRNSSVLENVAMLWIHLASVGGQGRNFVLKIADEKA